MGITRALLEKAGPPGGGWTPAPGIPGLWSQQCLGGVSSEEREDVEEVKRKPVGEIQTEPEFGKESPTGVRAVGTKAA